MNRVSRYTLFVLPLLMLLSSPPVDGQTLPFRYLGKDQGLNTVASMHCAIDAYGFFWLATSDGLARFNGKEITYYYSSTHPELPYDQIGYVFCDSKNRIWVCTEKGLTCIDENRKFHRHIVDRSRPDRNVLFAFEGSDGEIYAISEGETYAQNNITQDWISQPWLDSIIAGSYLRDLRRFDQDRYLLVSHYKGVIVFDTRLKRQETFIPVHGAGNVARFDSESILVGLRSEFGLVHVRLDDSCSARHIAPPLHFTPGNVHERIRFMERAIDGRVYMTTWGAGLLSIDSSLTSYTHYKHDPINPGTIIDDNLRYIITDSSGTLLFTSTDGANYTNVRSTSLNHINYFRTPEGTILDKGVINVAEDNMQRLWVCMADEILILDEDLKTTSRPAFPQSHRWNFTPPSPICVTRDAKQQMWVAWHNEGIGIFHPDGRFKTFISSKDYPGYGTAIDQVRVLSEGNDGFMYVGGESGFFRIRSHDLSMDTFQDHPGLAVLRDARVVDILTGRNELWVSTSPGGAAWHYSFTDKTLKTFTTENGLTSNRVYGLARDNHGSIYAGCYNGLSIIRTDSSIVHLVKDQGLISPRIEALEAAEDGTIWMTNNYNLLKYDPATEMVSRLGGKQGLKGIDFVIVASAKLSSGKLVFGANKGMVIADPATLKIETIPLTVHVFFHDEAGGEILCRHGEKRIFPSGQGNVRFSFSVQDILVEDQILFRYRITRDGKGSWSPPSLNSQVDFNPGPGSYQLEAEAYDGSEWYGLSKPIDVVIRYPWWQQWWFIVLLSAAIVSCLLVYYKFRINRYRKEIAVSRQISELESKALRAQMNPHFVFNCLNAIQECVVTGKIDEAYTYLSKFSRLLRLVLEHSDLSEITLHQEIEILELYVSLEKLRFRDLLEFTLAIDEDVESESILIPPMLIQPHIENAIWHGLRHKKGHRTLSIHISEQTDYLEVVVEDNGVGRKAATEINAARIAGNRHNSKGMHISLQRIALLQEQYPDTHMVITDLYDVAGSARGTRVTLHIPIVQTSGS